MLGIRTRGRRMVGADETRELCRPRDLRLKSLFYADGDFVNKDIK